MKEKFFFLAKQLSFHSNHYQHHHGAVIVRKNKVLGVGFNKDKTHPQSSHPFYGIHAEFSAILNTKTTIPKKCDIYIYRERKDGSIANSKPCEWCERLLRTYNIKNIYYTTENGYEHMRLS